MILRRSQRSSKASSAAHVNPRVAVQRLPSCIALHGHNMYFQTCTAHACVADACQFLSMAWGVSIGC